MAHYHQGLYSWYNTTLKQAFYWEDKELLQFQRDGGNECVNVESDRQISKKQMIKGVSKALQSRVMKGMIK